MVITLRIGAAFILPPVTHATIQPLYVTNQLGIMLMKSFLETTFPNVCLIVKIMMCTQWMATAINQIILPNPRPISL